MIRSFADDATHHLFEDGQSPGLHGLDRKPVLMVLDTLDAASALDPLRALHFGGLHAVPDSAPGRWAMTVSAQWRVTFSFRQGEAQEVLIEDLGTG